jgi:hypothetical protein
MASKGDSKDVARVGADDSASVVTLTREEYDKLLSVAEFMENGGTNPTPAVEEGPHLQDPEIRQAKVEQLRAAADDGTIDPLIGALLPDDMQALMEEAGV